jgi:hypothetical protein
MGLGLSICVSADTDSCDSSDHLSRCCLMSICNKDQITQPKMVHPFRLPDSAGSYHHDVDPALVKQLFTSVYFGKKKTLQALLRNNAQVDFSSVIWSKGLNALHIASMRGYLGCVKMLCSSSKFDIDRLDEVSTEHFSPNYCQAMCVN